MHRSWHRPVGIALSAVLSWVGVGCGGEPVETAGSGGGGGQGGGVPVPLVGVPSDGCAPGFEHDGDHGCSPVLPASCPPGQLAVPGETTCRPVAPCADGPWGDIPVDGATQHVDGSYVGGASDGTAAHPWTTITEAIAAAAPGAIVAIAAGSYAEEVVIDDQAVRLWGRCPELVEIVGPATALATLFARGTHGNEVHTLAVRSGGGIGVLGSGSDLLLDRVWIHDVPNRGVSVEETLGPTTVVMRDSLVEQVTEVGLYAAGSAVTVERSVIRDVAPHPAYAFGIGLSAKPDTDVNRRPVVLVSQSLFERNHFAGIQLLSADATVTACAIRDTMPDQFDIMGAGIGLAHEPGFEPGVVDVVGSTIERSHGGGIVAEAVVLTVAHTTIRSTEPEPASQWFGNGIRMQDDLAGGIPAQLHLGTSLVEDSHEVGVLAMNSAMTLVDVLIRRTEPRPDGTFGDGIIVLQGSGVATAAVTGTVVQDSARAGMANFGAVATIGGNRIQCSSVDLNGENQTTDFVFTDLGDNACGCPAPAAACHVLSTNLVPPEPM